VHIKITVDALTCIYRPEALNRERSRFLEKAPSGMHGKPDSFPQLFRTCTTEGEIRCAAAWLGRRIIVVLDPVEPKTAGQSPSNVQQMSLLSYPRHIISALIIYSKRFRNWAYYWHAGNIESFKYRFRFYKAVLNLSPRREFRQGHGEIILGQILLRELHPILQFRRVC
jgi:hypothetical protein